MLENFILQAISSRRISCSGCTISQVTWEALGRFVGLLYRLEYLRINVPPPNQHLPACLNIELVDLALDPFPTANQVLGDVFPSQLLLSTECDFRFRLDGQQTTGLLSDYAINDHCLDVTDT